jgi:hypothetical protein
MFTTENVSEQYVCDVDLHDVNQIKFVCRQLYAETAGLELKYNCIRFGGPDGTYADREPTELFVDFLRQGTPTKSRWIKRVILRRGYGSGSILNLTERFRSLLHLVEFCQSHPQAVVHYVARAFTYREHPQVSCDKDTCALLFLLHGACISLAIRSIDIRPLLPDDLSMAMWFGLHGLSNFDFRKKLDIQNLRFWPEEGLCARDFSDLLRIASANSRISDDMVETCIDHATKWIQEGL